MDSFAHDRQLVVVRSALQAHQLASLVLPLYYLARFALRRPTLASRAPASTAAPAPASALKRTAFVTRLSRRYALSSLLFAPALGAGYALARLELLPAATEHGGREDDARRWADDIRHDQAAQTREDYGVVGGVVGALAVPALLLRRAPALYLAGSGFSLGTAAGALWAYAQARASEGGSSRG
ncbi:uncharacterized protein JCM10292_000588 [Rhodotorula paludigena]|uniref:uncharacterized protein n=1 Tax=Rhodotorula paludigena TaxID=86838 RepID=UPI00316E39A6